jgi:MFS family permease
LRKTFSNLLRVPLRQHPSFGWLMVSRFGIMLGVYTVTFCLLYYIRDTLGQGEVRGRVVITQFMILATVTGLIGTLPTGIASDRFSKKLILILANSVCIVAGAAFAMAQDLNTAFIAVGIFGLGFGVFSAVDWALACNLLPPGAPAKYMGIWSLSDVLPQVVAPLIAGPVAYAINQTTPGGGYRFLMGLSIFYFFLGTVAISFIKENPVSQKVPKVVEDAV